MTDERFNIVKRLAIEKWWENFLAEETYKLNRDYSEDHMYIEFAKRSYIRTYLRGMLYNDNIDLLNFLYIDIFERDNNIITEMSQLLSYSSQYQFPCSPEAIGWALDQYWSRFRSEK